MANLLLTEECVRACPLCFSKEHIQSLYSTIPSPYDTSSNQNPNEFNALKYLYVIVKNKWWIIAMMLVGLIGGYAVALVKGGTFVAEVIIAPKEVEKMTSLPQLGALGGLVASQLNMTGNASLDKINLILNSREFNAKFVETFDLMPEIYKQKWHKLYHKYWDTAQQKWKPQFVQPNPLEIGAIVKGSFVKKVINDNTMTITIQSKDSAFTYHFAEKYIQYLNDYIKSNIQNDTKENIAYLKKIDSTTMDPLLREKILMLITNEIEKQMLVSKEAFKIVDPLYLSLMFKEKITYPLMAILGLFSLTYIFITFFPALVSSKKSEEDKQLIKKLKYEFFRDPARIHNVWYQPKVDKSIG
jgi:hypothetical protein